MKGETLTYDEIIERSKEKITKIDKAMFIYGIIAAIIMFVFTYLLSKDILMASVLSVLIIVFVVVIFLLSRKTRNLGIDKDISQYKDEINEYNVVYNDFYYIITKKHLIAVQHEDTIIVKVISLDEIDSFTTKKYSKGDRSYFNIKLVNGKLVILYLPDIFIEILNKYAKNK